MSPDSFDHLEHVIQRDVVVVGASAGGVDALQALVAGLPPEFPAAVLVVLHVSASGTSVLPQILSRRGVLPAKFANDGEHLERGQIYVARADHHLLVHGRHLRVTQGPRENGHRPAIDPLFRSAARAAGPRTIGVVLSGLLDDGAAGARFLKQHGGAVVVQDPEDARFPGMPLAALKAVTPDRVVAIKDMGGALCELVDETIDRVSSVVVERDRVELDPDETALLVAGPPTALTCPECGGTLWEQEYGGVIRYVCHVGHAYSLDSLADEQGRALETTLWSTLRSLEERAGMQRRLARRIDGPRRARHEERAEEAERHARAVREMLGRMGRLAVPAGEDLA